MHSMYVQHAPNAGVLAFDMEQRFLELGFSAGFGGLSVEAPARSTDAPPGTYPLFVIDSAGVPSQGRIVRIEPAAN